MRFAVAPNLVAAPVSPPPMTKVSTAHLGCHKMALREASRLQKARRAALSEGVELSGARCVAKLLKSEVVNRYSIRLRSHTQEPLRAADVDEPPRGSPIVEMLDALPHEERDYYSCESHVVDWTGKSNELFEEIQEQFAFVGGEYSEYVKPR